MEISIDTSNETTDRYFRRNSPHFNLTKHHNAIQDKNRLKATILPQ